MRKVRNILGVLAMMAVGLGIGACADVPTAAGDGDEDPTCWWVNGILYCDNDA
jgi:hypothetical protein